MIQSNRIEFTNSKLNMLSNAKKLYTNKEAFRANGKSYRLKLRVSENAKTFCLWYDNRRITLGQMSKDFGVYEATTEAIQIIGGVVTSSAPRAKQQIFADLAERVFQAKEKRGNKYVDVERRKFNLVPDSIKDQPIDKITREQVIEWKEQVIAEDKSWNTKVEVPNNVWNVCANQYCFSLLENRNNPFGNVKEKESYKSHAVPSFAQLKEIWKLVSSYDHPLLRMMVKLKILTGMHTSEILRIKLSDVIACDDWLEIEHKIGLKHKIYLTAPVRDLLKNFVSEYDFVMPDSPIFSYDGINPLCEKALNKHWLRATKPFGVNFRMDRIRHALITEMIECPYRSEYITGHCYKKDIQAKHYTDWNSEKMLNVFRETNEYWQRKLYSVLINQWF